MHIRLSFPSVAQTALKRPSTSPFGSEFLRTQLDKLTSAHDARLGELQKKLIENEREATNLGRIDAYRQEYVQAAKRISEEISQENQSFLEQLQALAGGRPESAGKAKDAGR